ncbi:MAG: HisA/HisF-related TIM barrel protein [Verrucomicrobiota bacterium]|nr:HisA/HisF-related TIM barrel protein [Verrucomicrobiota bacterium]HPW81366.1 HisA/HisF-related TIM barrel protein [Verrucomicrobiota bacterium]HQA42760.1 HisA/HisF-related TIM barrel protein [Verrucomicrobiota bacterium]HQF60804.1 HisA/HisF-related TIM barrel protein [Verrucomicrobiota bacterium]HQI34479.1 HisA/HisF-related TIM barrel protein [Verrucomicrobiota bacterium]
MCTTDKSRAVSGSAGRRRANWAMSGMRLPWPSRRVSQGVNVLVVAGGGAGRLDHMVQVLTQGAADAVLAASVFHFGRCTVADVKQHLAAHGIPVHAPASSLLPRTGAVSTGSNGSHT